MSTCLSVCLCQEILANRRTDMVLLYRVASHRSWKVYNYFGEGYRHPPKRNGLQEKIIPTQKKKKIFFNLNYKWGRGLLSLPSRDVASSFIKCNIYCDRIKLKDPRTRLICGTLKGNTFILSKEDSRR